MDLPPPPSWARAPAAPRRLFLLASDGNGAQRRAPIGERAAYFVGRHRACDIVVDHASASRVHACLAHGKDGKLYIADCGSVHGTFVDGVPLERDAPIEISAGCTFHIGACRQSLRVVDAETGQPEEGGMTSPSSRRDVKGGDAKGGKDGRLSEQLEEYDPCSPCVDEPSSGLDKPAMPVPNGLIGSRPEVDNHENGAQQQMDPMLRTAIDSQDRAQASGASCGQKRDTQGGREAHSHRKRRTSSEQEVRLSHDDRREERHRGNGHRERHRREGDGRHRGDRDDRRGARHESYSRRGSEWDRKEDSRYCRSVRDRREDSRPGRRHHRSRERDRRSPDCRDDRHKSRSHGHRDQDRDSDPPLETDRKRRRSAFSNAPDTAVQKTETSLDIVKSMMQAPGQMGGSLPQPGLTTGLTVEQKRHLLWGKKKQEPVKEAPAQPVTAFGANRWDVAEFSSGQEKEKFQRLMGVKSTAPPETAPETADDDSPVERKALGREQQEEVLRSVEQHFVAGLRRADGRTVGLGL